MTKNQKIKFIQEGFKLLKAQQGYNQAKVVAKLKHLACKTTPSTFNKIINNKEIGEDSIVLVFQGMIVLMRKELCMEPDGKKWKELANSIPEIVPAENEDDSRKGFIIYTEGRLEIAQKVDFFNSAEEEVYEFGITLNTFSSYLWSRKPKEFKEPLLALLEKGIHFKCFLMDPDWKGTSIYFEDRKKVLNEGVNGINKIKGALQKLKLFSKELESLKLPGSFEVYQYRHFPSNYFLVVDKELKSQAKMMVSNYLFGVQRAHCPVMEFQRKEQPILFVRYLNSLTHIIKDAKKVDFEKLPD